jgi:HEAT repeat protein
MMEEPTVSGDWIVEGLESRLLDVDPVVRARAAEALGAMRADAARALPRLAEISLADRDSGVRAAAVNAMTDIGAPEVLLLENAVALFDHPDQTVRARAAWAIGKLDPSVAAIATSQLGQLLASDPAIDARFGAAWAFGRMRLSGSMALEALCHGVRDSEGDVRAEVARALGRTGPAAASHAAPELMALLADSDPFAREQAAIALRRVEANSPEAIDGLRSLLSDATPYVRTAAADTLEAWSALAESESAESRSRMTTDSEPTGIGSDAQYEGADDTELEDRLNDLDDFVRAETPWKLAKMGLRASDRTTERLVIQALVDRDSDARWSALFAIARIAKRSSEVTRSVLLVLSGDRDPDVREAAAMALGALWREAPSEVVAGLAAALSDKDALVREDAADVLGQLGIAAMDAGEALHKAAADPHSGVRARASQTLSALAPAS